MEFRPTAVVRHVLHGLPLFLSLAAVAPSAALERGAFSLEVLVNGEPLTEYSARGTRYVEALEGREYSLRLRNDAGERIAVALSVDGLNSIDAKVSGASAAAKWILGPYETVTLDGWQTGSGTARRFFFTTEERSYGAWLGRTKNLGIISAAVFRERARPLPIQVSPAEMERKSGPARSGAAPKPSSARADDVARDLPEPSKELAATGIGREVEHRVQRVQFEAEPSPVAVLELRYEYHDALVQLGVLQPSCSRRESALSRRERARGFDDLDFAPDPYRAGER